MSEALSPHTSESSLAAPIIGKYCQGFGLDMGFGGSATVPTAITFDMPQAYTCVGHDRQILRGDCRRLPFICDGALDFMCSHHLLEDFYYPDLVLIIKEWKRCLKDGGLLITNCPDQQRFLAHCRSTGQGTNEAHKEQDFSLKNFQEKVLYKTGPWKEVFTQAEFGPYSWLKVVSKA